MTANVIAVDVLVTILSWLNGFKIARYCSNAMTRRCNIQIIDMNQNHVTRKRSARQICPGDILSCAKCSVKNTGMPTSPVVISAMAKLTNMALQLLRSLTFLKTSITMKLFTTTMTTAKIINGTKNGFIFSLSLSSSPNSVKHPLPDPENDPLPDPENDPLPDPEPEKNPMPDPPNPDPHPLPDPNPDNDSLPDSDPLINPKPDHDPLFDPEPNHDPLLDPDNDPLANLKPGHDPFFDPKPNHDPLLDPDNDPLINLKPGHDPFFDPKPNHDPLLDPDNDPLINLKPGHDPLLDPKLNPPLDLDSFAKESFRLLLPQLFDILNTRYFSFRLLLLNLPSVHSFILDRLPVRLTCSWNSM